MHPLRSLLAALVLTAALYVGARPFGSMPPLGPLLDPVNGVWAVATTARLPQTAAGRVPGLSDSVEVLYDDRGVPHIFALTVEDAVRAFGFVVARDRLFQLELQARATAGTLSELVGEVALPLDREQRALGLPWSAEQEFAALEPGSEAARVMTAYADGVNAWIETVGPRELPLEYRLLDVEPMRWHPQYSLYLMRRMGYMLTYQRLEFLRERVSALVGPEASDALFPIRSPIQEPLQPAEGEYPRFDTSPLPPPELTLERHDGMGQAGRGGDAVYAVGRGGRGGGDAVMPWGVAGRSGDAVDAVGSNNWAVSPSKSATGHALLAGDPHLELTLPSIWYEAHVVVPGELDVYGVTIPGSPSIIIGFSRDLAWSFTNTEADVLDYYREVLDDPRQPTRYRIDGEWRPLDVWIEEYRGRREEVLATDTVYHTHRGPIVWRNDRPLSIRWTVLESEGTANAIYEATRTRSVEEWLRAMEGYVAPAQNMIVADRGGNIAIRSTGRFPMRPGDGRGDVIRDGSTSASDWTGYWPVERYPFSLNPEQGYLASANQQPIDPAVDRSYLRMNWWAPWRAMRINQLLRASDSVTPDQMRQFQIDPGSPRADRFVPAFLSAVERVLGAAPEQQELREAAELLAEWDRRYTKENRRAVLFELAMEELEDRTWDELVSQETGDDEEPDRIATPEEGVLYQLLHDAESPWWDSGQTTGEVEDRDAILAASLEAALRRAKERYGDPAGDDWRWDRIRHANIHHVFRLPSLSALELPIQGGPSTLNPSSGSGVWGASWRMVVQLGPEIRAAVIYPGGQSANPVSPWYDDRIPKWVNGELDSALVPRTASDLAPQRIASVLILQPAR